jgi:hypothetical protein
MKLLLISDSHGRGLDVYIRNEVPSMVVKTVMVGGKMSAIRGSYREQLQEIVVFDPEVIVMHMGHNDLVAHWYHNTQPQFITAVFHTLMELKDEIHFNFPTATIFISSLLPIVSLWEFDEERTWRYNRIACRFGQMVFSRSKNEGSYYLPLQNREMWGRITQLEASSNCYDDEGLHMNALGRRVIVFGWADGFVVLGVV